MAATFLVGETVICSVEVKDDSGEYIDPSTSMQVAISRIKPAFTTVQASTNMVADTVGCYHFDYQSASVESGTYEALYIATDGTRITKAKSTFILE